MIPDHFLQIAENIEFGSVYSVFFEGVIRLLQENGYLFLDYTEDRQ